MKKTALLLLLVLGLSSTALGLCRVDITSVQPAQPQCGDDVAVNGTICGTGQWSILELPGVWKCGNIIYVDVYLTCESLCGWHEESGVVDVLENASCGLYTVVVRAWMDYSDCACWPYNMFCRPILCGMDMTTFKVGDWPCCCCCPTDLD